jgi:hypothetical protein
MGALPAITLDDNVVYLDATNLMTSPLMQYSMIKVILLARVREPDKRSPTVVVFGNEQRRARLRVRRQSGSKPGSRDNSRILIVEY